MIKQWLALGLVIGVFASCAQERNEPNTVAKGEGEEVLVSLHAEVSLDDSASDLRAINYTLGTNAKGAVVPMPQFEDGQLVDVHTIIKSNRPGDTGVAQTLKWRYSTAKKMLELGPIVKDSHGVEYRNDIAVSGFNNNNGTKWYISGLIGGALSGTKVEFMGTRVVKGVLGNVGDALESMEVPYAFGWEELTIDTESDWDGDSQSYKHAKVPSSVNIKFQPLGSILAVKLGNNQSSGAYDFSPMGFTISSNAWGDQGSFELNTTIVSTNPHTVLPTWSENICGSSMYYTFADGHMPEPLGHNETTNKSYYVWVMPHRYAPATAKVRVMLKGKSSRPETTDYKDYTNTWFTDYSTQGKATAGRVTQGKVHPLTARATRRVILPIEYVTKYNLAGGDGLTYTTTNFTSPQPAGVTGTLRFSDRTRTNAQNATPHGNDQSGYYNWYKVVGRYDPVYNPQTKNLQTEIDIAFDENKYYIPAVEQWWGIFPAPSFNRQNWTGIDKVGWLEIMRVGSGANEIRQSYVSDYSKGFSQNDLTSDATIYAIRFKASLRSCTDVTRSWDYDNLTETHRSHVYPSAVDNSMKCAYRFRRIGGRDAWNQNNNQNLTNQLIIDVVYLGEETVPTELSTISDDRWWSDRANQIISRTFPAVGYIYSSSSYSSGGLVQRGSYGYYWSTSQHSKTTAWNMHVQNTVVNGENANSQSRGFPVRLFEHRD